MNLELIFRINSQPGETGYLQAHQESIIPAREWLFLGRSSGHLTPRWCCGNRATRWGGQLSGRSRPGEALCRRLTPSILSTARSECSHGACRSQNQRWGTRGCHEKLCHVLQHWKRRRMMAGVWATRWPDWSRARFWIVLGFQQLR